MSESRQLRRSLLSLLPPLANSSSRSRERASKKPSSSKRRDSSNPGKFSATRSVATSRSLSPAEEGDAAIHEIHEITSGGRTCGPECRSCSFFDLSSSPSEASSMIDSDISSAIASSRSSASYSSPAYTAAPLTPVDSRNAHSPTRRGKKDSLAGSFMHYGAPPVPSIEMKYDATLSSLDRFTFAERPRGDRNHSSSNSSAITPRPVLLRSDICYFSEAEAAAADGDWPLQSNYLPERHIEPEFARPTRRHTDGPHHSTTPEERDFRPPTRRHTDGPRSAAVVPSAAKSISHPSAISRARSPLFEPSRPAPFPPLAFLAHPPPEPPMPSPRKQSVLRTQASFAVFPTPPLPPNAGERSEPEHTARDNMVAGDAPQRTITRKISQGFRKLASKKSFSRLRGGE